MKHLILIFLLFYSSCTTYRPVSLGSGKPSGKKVEGCSHYVFGVFPIIKNDNQLEKTLRMYEVKPKEVYAVDERRFDLLPIYSKKCTVLALNTKSKATKRKPKKQDPCDNPNAYNKHRCKKKKKLINE